MSDFDARIEHPEGPALGWASGPTIRFYDGTERPTTECVAADLLWLLDLPYADVAEAIERSFSRYSIKLGTGDESAELIDATIWAGLQNDIWADKALAWVKVHRLGDKAATALRDFVDRTGNEEATALLAAWREATKAIGHMSPADLKQFVLDMLGGRIFTSAHMSPHEQMNIGMVFMPLALGALTVPEAVLPHVEPLPPSPQEPKKEPHPDKPTHEGIAGKVPDPVYEEIDTKKIAELEFRERWDREPAGAAEVYKAEVAARNAKIKAEYDAKMAAIDKSLEEAMRTWAAKCRTIDKAHKKALASWEADMDAWREENAALLAAHAAREEVSRTWFTEHVEQIGIFWEYLDQAGPRSINGMPMFFSVRIMHKDDWQRAAAAYERERQRMDDLEV